MIGFLLNDGQDHNRLQGINKFADSHKCMVFSEGLIPALNTNVMQRYEAFHFNGTIITDSFRLSQQLKPSWLL
jgi:hypothetical protein